MEQLLQISGEMVKITTMSHGALRLLIDSQEGLTAEVKAKVMAWHEKVGYLTFSVEPIQPDDLANLPPLKWDKDERSKSQVLRGRLFRMWEKNQEGLTQNEHYDKYMSKFISWVDEKLT